MLPILYATGNKHKFRQAVTICQEFAIGLQQQPLDVPEIQAEDAEAIARDKAAQAFVKFGQPVIVSDDSWLIPGLGGFPGPYMRYVNDWFTADDWLRLTQPLKDRRIILRQCVVYQDASGIQAFQCDLEGGVVGRTARQSHAISTFYARLIRRR